MKLQLIYQWLNKISGQFRFFSLSLILCLSMTIVIIYVSSSQKYSSPTLMGLASGLGMVAALGLLYTLKHFKR